MTVAFPFPQEKYKSALMLQEKSTQSYWHRCMAGKEPVGELLAVVGQHLGNPDRTGLVQCPQKGLRTSCRLVCLHLHEHPARGPVDGHTWCAGCGNEGFRAFGLPTAWRRRQRPSPERDTRGPMNSLVTASRSSIGRSRLRHRCTTIASWAGVRTVCRRCAVRERSSKDWRFFHLYTVCSVIQ